MLADEFAFTFVAAALGFAIFSLRRWTELRREAAGRRRTEETLQQKERHFRSLIEKASDLITILDAQGTIRYESPAVERILGYHPEELVGRNAFELVHPDDVPRVLEAFARAVEDPELQITVEYRFQHKGGSWRVLESMANNLLADPAVAGFVANSRDVTDRTQAKAELLRAKEAAEAANRAKSEFLSSMSHELRTPLNSVIGFANVLGKNKAGNLRPQDLTYLERIQSNGKHLLGLINDILDLSKIEAGKMTLEPAPVALDALVRETVDALRGNARRGVEVLVDLSDSVALVETDAGKLRQVLINLVGNALKFTERESVRVILSADATTRRPTRIDVIDTGIGIPPERLGAVFQAFEQAESGTARRYGGTGLGLAISSSLCALMGFRIEVTSEVGAGSTFSIVLAPGAATPAAVEELPRVEVPLLPAAAAGFPRVPGMIDAAAYPTLCR